jgi:hypothetical protein
MISSELQHITSPFHISKVLNFYGVVAITVNKFQVQKNLNCYETLCNKVCCDIAMCLVAINFNICIPYYVTPCIQVLLPFQSVKLLVDGYEALGNLAITF